jgi:hypothetical protein
MTGIPNWRANQLITSGVQRLTGRAGMPERDGGVAVRDVSERGHRPEHGRLANRFRTLYFSST